MLYDQENQDSTPHQNRGWRELAKDVLQKSDAPMHYQEITDQIIKQRLRASYGATPAISVNTAINLSLRTPETPFIRISDGVYFLKEKLNPVPTQGLDGCENEGIGTNGIDSQAPPQDLTQLKRGAIIEAFGMFWQRDIIEWGRKPKILGKQYLEAEPVDFSDQVGIYILHDGKHVVYVGRSRDRSLGIRLYEHTLDRLSGRWDRFSWFGLKPVAEDGRLGELINTGYIYSQEVLIETWEALLIEGLEPPQNRKRGDNFSAIEYLQAEDPDLIAKKQDLLNNILKMR